MIRPIVPPKDLLGLHYRLPYIFLLEPRAPIPSPTVRQQHPRVQAPPSAPFPSPFSKLAVINFQRERRYRCHSRERRISFPISRKRLRAPISLIVSRCSKFFGGGWNWFSSTRNGKKKHSYRSWARFFPLIANGSSRIQVATADDKLSPASLVMHTIAPQYFTLPTSNRASLHRVNFPFLSNRISNSSFHAFSVREIHLIIISKQPRTFRLSIFCYLKIGGGGGARRRKRAAISSPFGGRLISRESGDHRGERVQRWHGNRRGDWF